MTTANLTQEVKAPETYNGMALSRIVAKRRLVGLSRMVLKADSICLDTLQSEVFTYAFAVNLQTGYDEEISVQQVARAVSEAVFNLTADIHQEPEFNLKGWLAVAKHIIHAFVADGWINYHAPKPYKKADETWATIPAFYTMTGAQRKKVIADILHDSPKVIKRYLKKGTKHHEGALALSAKKFTINLARGKIARENINKLRWLDRDGNWQQLDYTTPRSAECKEEHKLTVILPTGECVEVECQDKNLAKFKQQKAQFNDACNAYRAKPEGWHFAVKADFRGRLYYVSGMLNPQAGGVAAYLLGNDDTITYDSTASFAQFISILTGDIHLANACNLRNFDGPVKDFYAETYSIASGNAAPAKHTVEREIAKKYLMPKAYGSGDETSAKRAMDTAREEGIDEEVALAIVDSLRSYTGLNTVKTAASKAVMRLAAVGQQLAWTTPSGFNVKQNYWRTESLEWDTGESNQEYIPTSVTFKVKTDKVAVSAKEDEGNERSANVAAAANFIQSLDATFAALVAREWFKRGNTLVAVHDSFTFEAGKEEEFKLMAWQVFCRIADSKELADMRTCIDLPQKELLWLNPNRVPQFIDRE